MGWGGESYWKKQMNKGPERNWEEKQKEKKVQKTLDNWDEKDDISKQQSK